MNTRSSNEVWLIGKAESRINRAGLPTIGATLRHFTYHHLECNKSIRESLKLTIEAVLPFWNKARIPTRRSDKCREKLEKVWTRYQLLKKSKSRSGHAEKANEGLFVSDLEDLFDIAHQDAMSLMTNDEDKEFLILQRQDTKSCSMGGTDKIQEGIETRKRHRTLDRNKRMMKRANSVTSCIHDEEIEPYEEIQELQSDDASDPDYQPPLTSKASPRRTKHDCHPLQVVTPKVAAAMDRVKISDRAATYVAASIVQSVGKNLDDVVLSRSSIRRSRQASREQVGIEIQQSFSRSSPLLLHWDSKILPDITNGNSSVDRVAILVSGGGIEQLLAVPKISRGTGENQAKVCVSKLEDWDIKDLVRGLVFDTTAANTGLTLGACTFLEKELGGDLIWIACRHHIFEIVLGAVFNAAMGPSDGPNVTLFKRFRNHWDFIDKSSYSAADDDAFPDSLAQMREDAKSFYMRVIHEKQVREDYLELLQLSLAFISGGSYTPPFRAPGAIHNARWMAKGIYCIKIMLFHEQFRLTSREKINLKRVAVFVSVIYTRFWQEAPLSTRAPVNDVNFLRIIHAYPDVGIRDAADKAFRRHLWFFSEQLVTLALFDDRVQPDVKARMVENLDRPSLTTKALKRLEGSSFDENASLETFVSCRSMDFFDLLSFNGKAEARTTFLQKEPAQWSDDSTYTVFQERARTMKVVNDVAERGIALIEQYSGQITKDEKELQCLLLLVDKHRKKVTEPTKANLK